MTATPNESPAHLRDGRPLWIGPVTPAARPLIVAAMSRLSPETSRRRFFTVRHRLSDPELDALTNLDGHRRFAIGASVRGTDGTVEGVGVARYARLAETPTAAEFALLVVDPFQGQGVGKLLLARLAATALARGIHRFVGNVLTDNDAMLGLLTSLAPGLALARDDGSLRFDVPLDPRLVGARVAWRDQLWRRVASFLDLGDLAWLNGPAVRPGTGTR